MAALATIARPYAEAVFNLADAAGELARWSDELARLAAVATAPEVVDIIGDPNLSADQLYGVLAAGAPDIGSGAQNLLRLLIDNGRVSALPEIRAQFEALKLEREGVVDARIETAYPLADAQLAAVIAQLEERFRRKVKPEVSVNPELIGGVCITVGDEIIDASVRGKLAAMGTQLMKQ